jgi:hypothetical protein
MTDRKQIERIAARGKAWAQEQLRDIEEDERQQAAELAASSLAEAEQRERERVHDVHFRLAPALGDCGVLSTGDVQRLGPWVEGPDGLRYRLVAQRYHAHMPAGPWFVESWWRPHLDALQYSSTFALEETPRLLDVLSRRRGEPALAAQDFASIVQRGNHEQVGVFSGIFAREAPLGTAASIEHARMVDHCLRKLGVSLLGDNGPRLDALRERVRQLWGLEIPGQITEHVEPSAHETARQLRRATAPATDGGTDAA